MLAYRLALTSDAAQARRDAGLAFGRWRTRPTEAHRVAAEQAFQLLMSLLLGVDRSEIHIARGPEERVPGALNFDLGVDPAVGPAQRTGSGTLAVGPGAFWSQASLLAALRGTSF